MARTPFAALGLIALCAGPAACGPGGAGRSAVPPIVGTWVVRAPGAPFPLHMFVFHADGTVEQSNPDAGDPSTSDSNLMGAWVREGAAVRGKAVEITADRTTHQLVSRGEVAFSLKVEGDAFSGTASATFYDADGRRLRGPVQTALDGQRVLP